MLDRGPHSKAVRKYLRDLVVEDSTIAATDRVFGHVIVIPARDESTSLVDGLRAAAESCGSLLAIVVINGRDDDPPAVHARNAGLLRAVRGTNRAGPLSMVAIDRCSPGRRLGHRAGVGTARRIGWDLALSLWQRGRIASPWLHGTDADARLGPSHFTEGHVRSAVARVHPVWHVASGDELVDRATTLYELWLRYWVLGLAWARSPYAHSTIGSATSVHAWAYAAVRGVPQREAGEDFHLLSKVAKLGEIERSSSVVEVQSRMSDRVPFGTGPAVARIARSLTDGTPITFYAPQVFVLLQRWLVALAECARCDRVELLDSAFDELDPPLADCGRVAVQSLACIPKLAAAVAGSTAPRQRARRLAQVFDGLATLRFVHAVRDAGVTAVAWQSALEQAPFVPRATTSDLPSMRAALLAAELSLPGSGVPTTSSKAAIESDSIP